MKMKTSVSLMVALVLAGVTTKVGLDMMKKYRPGGVASLAKVVVATRDMEVGHVIADGDVELAEVPTGLVPAKAAKKVDEVVGRTVKAQLATGQAMFDGVLTPKGAGSGLQALVPKGMRMVTIDVSDSSAVAGMLVEGCRVDLIATLRKADTTIAKPVVENVKVQSLQRQQTGYSSKTGAIMNGPVRSVTLLVTPKQAAAIELANASGSKPRLVLRGNSDDADADGEMNQYELLGEAPPEPVVEKPEPPKPDDSTFANVPPPEPVSKGRPVEIIRSGKSETIYYDDQNNPAKKEEGSAAPPNPKGGTTGPASDEPRTASGKAPESSARTEARSVAR
jgi:Flp pilus assembly protein CpaB